MSSSEGTSPTLGPQGSTTTTATPGTTSNQQSTAAGTTPGQTIIVTSATTLGSVSSEGTTSVTKPQGGETTTSVLNKQTSTPAGTATTHGTAVPPTTVTPRCPDVMQNPSSLPNDYLEDKGTAAGSYKEGISTRLGWTSDKSLNPSLTIYLSTSKPVDVEKIVLNNLVGNVALIRITGYNSLTDLNNPVFDSSEAGPEVIINTKLVAIKLTPEKTTTESESQFILTVAVHACIEQESSLSSLPSPTTTLPGQ